MKVLNISSASGPVTCRNVLAFELALFLINSSSYQVNLKLLFKSPLVL